MTFIIEADTRILIDNSLKNKGWILEIDNPDKNVFFESDINRIIDNKKLKKLRKRPDYVLTDKDKKPIAIIEAKSGGKNLKKALEQATEYAEILDAPLIFAMNNNFCETMHLAQKKPLFINENEVNELIRQKEAVEFLKNNTNSIYTIPKEIIVSRKELISIFNSLNNSLRAEGIRAGIERLSEFANILFLKLYTENNLNYDTWNSLKFAADNILIGVVNLALKKINEKYKTDIFNNVAIKNPKTLRKIINSLDNLHLSNIKSDIKGDAFEYFLQKATATENDLGEYFTPRHIIKTIINLVNPKFGEKVYDPFCGTGGFLTEAFNHIKEKIIINNDDIKNSLEENTIFGGEITTSARLAKMNMILHGDGHSGVNQINSLENPRKEEFDVVVTNVPFSQKTDFSYLYENSLAKNSGDGVCALHCFKSVKKGGRMALIIPEGFLVNRDLKGVRKFLLNNSILKTVISLPRGVFLPYTNVKTYILYFTDIHSGKTNDDIWYFEVKNDGYSLDNNRIKIKDNDLKMVDYINLTKSNSKDITEIGFKALNFNEIKNNNYELVGSRYIKDIKEGEQIKTLEYLYENNIINQKKGDIITKKEAKEGNVPVIAGGVKSPYNHNNFNYNNEIITISSSGTAGYVSYHDYPIWASDCIVIYSKNENILLTKFLYYCMKNQQESIYSKAIGSTVKHVYWQDLKKIQIPLISIQLQRLFIKEVKEYENTISNYENKILSLNNKIKDKINLLKNEKFLLVN